MKRFFADYAPAAIVLSIAGAAMFFRDTMVSLVCNASDIVSQVCQFFGL